MTLPSLPPYRDSAWYAYMQALDTTVRSSSTGIDVEAVQDTVAAMIVPGTGISTAYDDTAGALTITNTGGTGTVGGITAVAATKTTSTTLTVSQHNPVDATGGNRTMTLPSADAGLEVSVEKIDSSANTVTVSGPIHGLGTTTVVLTYQYDGVRLVGKSDGTWWISAYGRNTAALDAEVRAVVNADAADPDSALNAKLVQNFLTLQSATDFGLASADSFKPSSTSRVSTATAADDPDLLLAVDPNVAYRVRGVLFLQSDVATDFKCKWSVPSGTAMRWSLNGPSTVASAGSTGASQWDVQTATSTAACGGLGGTQPYRATIEGIIETGSVGGTLKLQWAQNASGATATTMFSGSSISLTRVGFTGSLTDGVGTITLPYTQAFGTGTTWPAEWTTAGTSAISGGVGTLSTSAVALTAANAYLSGMPDTADVDVTVDYITPATLVDQYVSIGARGNGTFSTTSPAGYNPTAGYWTEIRPFSSGGYIGLYRANSTGNGTAMVTDVPFTWAVSTTYHIRFQCLGSTVRVRIWTGATEPTTWTATTTDATYASGRTFLSVTNATANVRTATFDNYGVAVPSTGIDTPASFSNLNQFQLKGNTVKIQTPGLAWSFSAVSDALSKTGATYSRHELRDGDRWTDGRERCELRWNTHDTAGGYLPFGTNVYVSYAFRWSGALPTGDYNIITQMNQELSQAPEETLTTRHAAVFSLGLQPSGQGGLRAYIRGDTNFVGATDPGQNTVWTAPSVPAANTWQYIVYRMKFSKTAANGELDIYYNGTAVYSSTGLVNAYNDNTGPYLKMGQYRGYPAGFSATHETCVIEIANHEVSFSSLLGRVSSPLALPNLP